MKPQIAIELNGKSHNTDKIIARDEFVGEMYEKVGIRFITFKIGDNFKNVLESILNESRNFESR